MNNYSFLQLIIYMGTFLLLVKPLGTYMAKIYQGERIFLDRALILSKHQSLMRAAMSHLNLLAQAYPRILKCLAK